MALTKVSYSMIQGAPANVLDFGAAGDGVTDDTVAIQAALNSGALGVVLPDTGSFYVCGNVNAPTGVKISGTGKIKFTGLSATGDPVPVSVDNTPTDSLRVMFVLNSYSVADLLQIKALGYTTIMHYAQFVSGDGGTMVKVLNNAAAIGMNVIVSGQSDTPTTYDTYPATYGYYLFDEPSHTPVSVANQEVRIGAWRAVTEKPLCIADFGDYGLGGTKVLASSWDIIFVDSYYNPSNTNYNASADFSNVAAALISWENMRYNCTNARLIPLAGLFTGASSNKAKNISYSSQYAQLSQDKSVSVFCWDVVAVYPGTYSEDVANDADYRATAQELIVNAQSHPGFDIQSYYWTNASDISNLMQVYDPTYTNANVKPYSVINVGSAVDARHQAFGYKGLASNDAGGLFASKIKTLGAVWWRLTWYNPVDGNAATVVISDCNNDFYTLNTLETQNISSGGSATKIVSSDSKMLAFTASYTGTYSQYWKFLNAEIITSNWASTSF